MGHFLKKKNKKIRPLNAREQWLSPVVFHFALFDNKLIYNIKSIVMTTGRDKYSAKKCLLQYLLNLVFT